MYCGEECQLFPLNQWCSPRQSWCHGQHTPPKEIGPHCGLFLAMFPWPSFLHHRQFLLSFYVSALSLSDESCWRAHMKHTTPRERNKFSDDKHWFSETLFVQTHSSRPISSTNCFVKPSDTYSCSNGFWMQISLVHTSCSWIIMFLLASVHHEYFWARIGLNQVCTWRMWPKFHSIKVHWIIQVMICSLQYIW